MARDLNVLNRVYEIVEKTIVVVLLVMLMLVLVWATSVYTLELLKLLGGRVFGGQFVTQAAVDVIFNRLKILHEVFGCFLLILIGVELMKTVAMYLTSHEMHVEVVFTVAIIAIARHAIDLDLEHLDPMQLVGLGALVTALAVGYYFFRKAAALPFADPTDGSAPPGR